MTRTSLLPLLCLALALAGCSSSTGPGSDDNPLQPDVLLFDFESEPLGPLEIRNTGVYSLRVMAGSATVVDGAMATRAVRLDGGQIRINHPSLSASWSGDYFSISADVLAPGFETAPDNIAAFNLSLDASSFAPTGCLATDRNLVTRGSDSSTETPSERYDRIPIEGTQRVELRLDFVARECHLRIDNLVIATVALPTDPGEADPGLNAAAILSNGGVIDNLRIELGR